MTTGLIGAIVLAATLGILIACRHSLPRRTLPGVITAVISSFVATAIAAISYVAVDLGELTLFSVLLAPMFEGAAVAAIAGVVFAVFRHRLNAVVFIVSALLCGAMLAVAVGEAAIGHSPHFSHERAVVFLVVSWTAVAALTAFVVLYASNNSMERTRGR